LETETSNSREPYTGNSRFRGVNVFSTPACADIPKLLLSRIAGMELAQSTRRAFVTRAERGPTRENRSAKNR